jgi:hypothetical protein
LLKDITESEDPNNSDLYTNVFLDNATIKNVAKLHFDGDVNMASITQLLARDPHFPPTYKKKTEWSRDMFL